MHESQYTMNQIAQYACTCSKFTVNTSERCGKPVQRNEKDAKLNWFSLTYVYISVRDIPVKKSFPKIIFKWIFVTP